MKGLRYYQMLVSPHVGGGAKLALEIHKHTLAVRGPVSHLLVPPGGEAERTVRSAGFDCTTYRADRLTGSGYVRGLLENLQLAWRTGCVQGLVHVHSPVVYGAARTFFQVSGLRTALHIHLDFEVEELTWALKSAPDLLILCANFMRKNVELALEAVGSDSALVRTVHNAVDVDRFFPGDRAAEKKNLGEHPDVPLLMVVANLAPHKGQETAIRTVQALKQMRQRVRLWLIGAERDGSTGYLNHLKSLCRQLGVDEEVYFAGFRSDTPQLLRAADFLLLPSTSEGLPLVILEAQASRVTTLAAPTAGIPEVIKDGETGFLVPAHDHQAYAARLDELLKSPRQVDTVTEAAYQRVRSKHAIPHYCQQILDLYDALGAR